MDSTSKLRIVLLELEKARIIRNSNSKYEFAHDFIAHKILNKLTDEQKRINEVERIINNRFQAYKFTHVLLTKEELAIAKPLFGKLRFSNEISVFVEDSTKAIRRKKIQTVAFMVVVIIAIISFSGFGIYEWAGSRIAKLQAERSRVDADSVKKVAAATQFKNDAKMRKQNGDELFETYRNIEKINEFAISVGIAKFKTVRLDAKSEHPAPMDSETDEDGEFYTTDGMKYLNQALEHYTAAWKMDSTLYPAFVAKLNILYIKGEFSDALDFFRGGLARNPEIAAHTFSDLLKRVEVSNDTVSSKREMQLDFIEKAFKETLPYTNRYSDIQLQNAALSIWSYVSFKAVRTDREKRFIRLFNELLQKVKKPQIRDRVLFSELFLLSNDSISAEQILKTIHPEDSGAAPAYLMIARLYRQSNFANSAISYYKKAERLRPDSAEIKHRLGIVYEDKSRYKEASHYFLAAFQLDRSNRDYMRHVAFSLYSSEKYDSAIIFYDRVLKLKPMDEDALHYKGKCLEGLKMDSDAHKIFEQLVTLNPSNYHYRGAHLAPAYVKLGKISKGLDSYSTAIDLGAQQISNLSKDDEKQITIEQALRKFRQELFDGTTTYYYSKAKYDSAMIFYDRILFTNQNHENALHFKGKSLEGLRRYQEANEIFSILKDRYPKKSHYLGSHYAANLVNLNQKVDGLHTYVMTLQLIPDEIAKAEKTDDIEDITRAAYQYSDSVVSLLFRFEPRDDTANLFRYYRSAFSALENLSHKEIKSRTLPTLYNNYAWNIALTNGNLENALKYSQKAIGMTDNKNSLGYYWDTLAEIYYRMGQFSMARLANQKAISYTDTNTSKKFKDDLAVRKGKIDSKLK